MLPHLFIRAKGKLPALLYGWLLFGKSFLALLLGKDFAGTFFPAYGLSGTDMVNWRQE
jgi:hypothetical protein